MAPKSTQHGGQGGTLPDAHRRGGWLVLQDKCCAGSLPPCPLSRAPQGSLGDPNTLTHLAPGRLRKGLGEVAGKADMTTDGEMQIAGVWEMLQPLGVCKQWGSSPGDPSGIGCLALAVGGSVQLHGGQTSPQDNQPALILNQLSRDTWGLQGGWLAAEGGLIPLGAEHPQPSLDPAMISLHSDGLNPCGDPCSPPRPRGPVLGTPGLSWWP